MRPSLRGAPFVLGVAFLLAAAGPALPTTVRVHSLPELVAKADRIVVADVVDVQCEWEAGRDDRVPVTRVTLRTLRTLKGSGGVNFVLEFLGGAIDGERLDVLDVPRFQPGERDVLFLREGSRAISPLVGTMRGRFRVIAQDAAPRERIAAFDGRPLFEADLAPAGVMAEPAEAPLSLASFEKAVLELTAGTPDGVAAPATGARAGIEAAILERSARSATPATALPPPTGIHVNLGASPALIDGCPDWRCVIEAALARTIGLSVPGVPALPSAGGADVAELSWATAIFGRTLDEDTLAVSFRRTGARGTRTTVVFNGLLSWNAYDGPLRSSAGGEAVLDLARLAERELAGLFDLAPASAPGPGASPRSDLATARRNGGGGFSRASPSARTEFDRRDALGSACDSGGVVVDPRRLAFDSPDHSIMTAYQVGFFRQGAVSPAQVVDLPLTAFLMRRVIDLPAWASLGLQTSLAVDIQSAGLTTPIGVIYAYRVRGVWAGGTTDWSEPSQLFVRCATTLEPVSR